jgi:hypothetical protein
VYPNPATGVIYFESPSAGTVNVTDISGRNIYSGIVDYAHQSVDISGFATGVYLISLQTERETFRSKIFVK